MIRWRIGDIEQGTVPACDPYELIIYTRIIARIDFASDIVLSRLCDACLKRAGDLLGAMLQGLLGELLQVNVEALIGICAKGEHHQDRQAGAPRHQPEPD